jgi:fibronectin type 3 domain-containing protein
MAAAIRTADWIGAEYSNQKANSTFLGLGSEVTSAPPLVATTYSDTGLSSGTGYSYRVQAVDMAANVSPFSNTASAITQTPPTAPGNVTAAAVSASQINLSWTASSSTVGLANYIVQRCQGAGCSNFAQIAAPAATAFSDTGLSSGTSYSYRVQAVDTATNPSPFSNIASAATQTAPTAPSNLTATATSTSQIDLSWTASTSSAGIATYVVQRCQGAGCSNFAPIAAAFVNGYNYRRALTVDHNQVPNTDQSNFPVLVRLTNPSLKTVANGGKVQNANGYDIAFYSDQQGAAPLVWELDSYDGVNGILAAWVKLPVVSHGADTTFYLFYGNPSVATFQSIPSSVWSNGFSGVWHLPNGTVLTGNDSTTNNNASTLNGSTATAGQIDGAAGFIHGQNQFIRLSEANNGAYSFGDVTLSGWFKDTVNDTAVLWHQNGQPLMAVVIGDPAGQGAAGHRLNVYWRSPTTAVNILNGTTTADDGAWHHFAVTRSTASGAPMRLYVDGVLQAASSGTNETLVTGSGGVHYIGGTASSNNLTGAADEMRMAAAIRTADWIAAEYSNQKANSTFLGLGSEVASGSLPLLATTFSDTGLSPSTTYSYRVQAIDTASNPSPFSNTASATTQTPGGQSVTSALTSSLSCNPASLGPNASSTCTIALSRAAPGGGATVTLTNTNAMLTVPASVTVAAATTSATFHVATAAIPGDQSATVTSTYNGSSSSATISLVAPVLVSALSCNPVTLGPGAASVCTVTLNKNALAGGASVAVSTVNSLLTAPSPLTIAAGSSSASFTLQAGAFTANQSGSVTATYNGSTQSAAIALTVSVRVSSLVCTPTGVMSGAATSCTVTLSQPAPTNTTVALSSSSTLIAVPVGIVVTAGSTTKTFSASIASIAADTKGEVTATLGTSSQTVSLILWSTPALSSLACTTTKLAIGASTACTVTLSKSAGDVVVSLASNNPAIVVPATVTVPQGSSTAVFSATAQAAASGVVVSATFNGVSKSQSLAVSTTTP